MTRSTLSLFSLLAVAPVAAAAPNAASPPPGALVGSMTGEAATALARRVAPAVETLRGARFAKPVEVKLVDDAAARKHFQARLLKFWPEDQVRYDQEAYANLGLVPPGTDLMGALLDLMEEQAGGYYDPESRTFFMLSDMPSAAASIFVAHELTHALDDQRFGLDTLMEKHKDDDDRGLAISALAEGSATVVMSLFILQEMQAGRLDAAAFEELQRSEAGRAKKLAAAPAVLQRNLIGPYLLGQAFLLQGGPEKVATFKPENADRAFRSPPQSSEQLIHSAKYWDPSRRDDPRPVRLPDISPALGAGWSRVATGTMGELTLAVLTGLGGVDVRALESARPETWTTTAAAGWGGDVFQHYVNGPNNLTVLAVLWDTPGDAAEFEQAVPESAGRKVYRRWDNVIVLGGDLGSRPDAVAEAAFTALATGKVASGTAAR